MSDAASPAAAVHEPIAFADLQAQRRRLGERMERAISRVLDHGKFIMGPEVFELEERLADFCGVKHAVGCASGTDALLIALMAWEVGPGDAVFVPGFTFASTAEVVALLGATPVFVDVLTETFNLDPASLRAAVPVAADAGLRPRAVVPVDLFGQPADYDDIGAIAREHDLLVLADGAQSLGATWRGRMVGSLAPMTATSFFPAKPLGCYGDGGAVFTDDDAVAEVLRSLRVHGQGSDKYDNVRVGVNGRLDTVQASVLLEKLTIFPEEIGSRQAVAARYGDALADVVGVPTVADGATSAWAQYTVLIDGRDRVAAHLKERGIPSAVYYPKPLHLQPAYRRFPCSPGGLPSAEALAARVLSLPMHPYLRPSAQQRVVDALRRTAA